MFFTPELLAKRESGFGLLWLAATLGSKSAFKKLPKRSVLTADITQLCDLISEPAEPLALRLSSNLMFGVVRVYKVKQDIFLTDVTNCVASLKKIIQDLAAASEVQLQMANPVLKASALTIVPDPKAAYMLDRDLDWDAYLNDGPREESDDSSDEYGSKSKKKTKKPGTKSAQAPAVEAPRQDAHTLEEHHEHLLSASFDLSFNYSGPGEQPSSSQIEGDFNDFFVFPDALDVGDGLDDLAREIGWATSPIKSVQGLQREHSSPANDGAPMQEDFDLGLNFDFQVDDTFLPADDPELPASRFGTPCPTRPKPASAPVTKDQTTPTPVKETMSQRASSYEPSFSRLFLSQDVEPAEVQPLRDITAEEQNRRNQADPTKKLKRTRLLLDARTELTDQELKIARMKYVQSQNMIRNEMLQKRLEKETFQLIEDRIWGAPTEIQSPGLIDFWQENFQVQVEARSGVIRLHNGADDAVYPRKRRKITPLSARAKENQDKLSAIMEESFAPHETMEMDNNVDYGFGMDPDMGMMIDEVNEFRHSSEEPGQGRRVSRAPSLGAVANVLESVGLNAAGGSQKSSMFPWDHAGPSSSSGNVPLFPGGGSDRLEQADVRLRSSSASRRGSSIAPSQKGSLMGVGLSPIISARHSVEGHGEDFLFDLDNDAIPEEANQETQQSEMNLLTLERNSANFLEYTRMQYQGLSQPQGYLTFENVVPKASSTRHVAAAAFYHCLVLATKRMISLRQMSPDEPVMIAIV